MIDLTGVFPPIPTPFDEDGEVVLPKLRDNLLRWEQEPLAGYVVGGSNGEFVHLEPSERQALVRTAREVIGPERTLISGAGESSTRATLKSCQLAAAAGADAVLVITPAYYRNMMTSQALVTHFRAVADGSPIPLVIYSVPAYTGIEMPEDATLQLAGHPNIIGIKDGSGDVGRIATLVEQCGQDLQVLAGSGGYFLPALLVGAVGCVAALANIAPRPLDDIRSLFEAGDLEGAGQLQQSLVELNQAVTSRLGVPGLKAALDMVGLYGGPVRGPLLPLEEGPVAELRTLLAAAGLIPRASAPSQA